MLTDIWVICLLLLQFCSLFLVTYASVYAIQMLQKWDSNKTDETQLQLERQNYLVGTLAQVALIFQILGLVVFVFLSNAHLPSLIKGAMCAAGVLQANAFGNPLLYLKSLSILVYIIFLIYQFLEEKEPNYPLSPKKYYWLFPSFACIVVDIYLAISFFANIEPDRIVTCCSLTFVGQNTNSLIIANNTNLINIILAVWAVCFLCLQISFSKIFRFSLFFQVFFGISYIVLSIWTLQHFFVKYIYGVPTHFCLHDLFLWQYGGIGFAFFGFYYVIGSCLIFKIIAQKEEKYLPISKNKHTENTIFTKITYLSMWLSFLLPIYFYWVWKGNL